LPSVAEILMLPYLATQKYIVKSGGSSQTQAAGDRDSDLAETESVK
jgi:hypothetical protein